MVEQFQHFGEQFQKVSKDSYDTAVRSFGEVTKGLQAITAEFADFSKKALEDGTHAFEQMMGVKSIEQAIEIQSQYTRKAYDSYITEMSKLGEMYAGLARSSYKPSESTRVKKTS
jgi:hypothetical protein